MREILFRGKRNDNGEWAVSGDVFLGGKRKYIYIPNPDTDMSAKAYLCREVIPETVGQYTGLTDKNGKEIFEGDIVKDCYGRIAQCLYNETRYRLLFNGTHYTRELEFASEVEYEIIGNIHDNPELLGGANND